MLHNQKIIQRIRQGSLQDTLRFIQRAFLLSIPQTRRKASSLKGPSLADSGRNIYEYLARELAYKLDTYGTEEIRTAAQSEIDKEVGIDCEDYTIYAAALAINMGYKAHMEVVALDGNTSYQHVYAVIRDGSQEVVIDPTPDLKTWQRLGFNTRPPHITKRMKIELLDTDTPIQGFGHTKKPVYGFGAVEGASDITRILMDKQSELVSRMRENSSRGVYIAPELRKLRFAIMLNGAPEQQHFVQLLPVIADIDAKGEILWKDTANLREVASFVELSEAVYEAETQGVGDPSMDDLQGLGFLRKGGRQKAKQKLQDIKKKIVDRVRKKTGTSSKSKKAPKTGRVGKVLARFNPAGIAGRNALLLSMKSDFAGLATKLKWGYLSEKAAAAQGMDLSMLRKIKRVIIDAEAFFEKMGGKAENLRSAIIKGGKQSLGALPAIPAILAAASSILKPLLEKLKGIDLRKLFKGAKGKAKEAIVEKAKRAFSQATKGAAQIQSGKGVVGPAISSTFNEAGEAQIVSQTMNQNPPPDTGGKNHTPILIGTGVLAGIGLLLYFTL
ncbi:MAG: transglutaminase-like domain-containing protein [Bacteroidota bacterium]